MLAPPFFPMHRPLAFSILVFGLGLGVTGVLAQSTTRIFDIALGSPVSALPHDEFVDPACGTNGGPPALPLAGFEDFARCPVEEATGLRQVWFIYDDEWEYIARANREERIINRYSANTFFRQPIITSLMIDDAGLVQGYRVITDPRAHPEVRIEGFMLSGPFKGMFSDAPWTCTNFPPGERQEPIEGIFINTACELRSEAHVVKLVVHHFFKPGQDLRAIQRFLDVALGQFESSTRLEVYGAEAVTGAPCCRASAFR